MRFTKWEHNSEHEEEGIIVKHDFEQLERLKNKINTGELT